MSVRVQTEIVNAAPHGVSTMAELVALPVWLATAIGIVLFVVLMAGSIALLAWVFGADDA